MEAQVQVIKEVRVWSSVTGRYEFVSTTCESCDDVLSGYELGRNYRTAAGAKVGIAAMKKNGLRDDSDRFVILETTYIMDGSKRTQAFVYEKLA